MASQTPLYITCAIDYVNSTPHIGTAYEKIGADVLARWGRLQGRPVRLQLGNDEHSINVFRSAQKKDLDPLAYCDTMETAFRKAWDHLNISYDGFIRTTNPDHKTTVAALFTAIANNTAPDGSPNIYKSTYNGWYCDSCEAFYTDKDLNDKKCPVHGLPAKWVEEDNYFFALSKYGDWLKQYYADNPNFVLPDIRRNELLRLLEEGLQDISISREGSEWGIRLPDDEKHTVYVWFDALINYATAVGFGRDDTEFQKWWNDGEVVHVIGKDITRFHCVIWPIMLQAAGIALPNTVFGHGFVYHRGERMSKTLGNVLDPLELSEQYGPDPLRYFLLRENSFGRDGDFTYEQFIDRYNGDLANGIGNLVSRTAGMIKRYLSGTCQQSAGAIEGVVEIETLRSAIMDIAPQVTAALDHGNGDIHFHDALASIWKGVTAADRFINENEPWNLKKAGNDTALHCVLAEVVAALRPIILALSAFCPDTAHKAWDILGFNNSFGNIEAQGLQSIEATVQCFPLPKDTTLGYITTLFPRIEPKENDVEATATPEKTTAAPVATPDPVTNLISIQDFAKVELKVATITAVDPVEGADRLLKIQVDLGSEQRQIVSGIAQHYTSEELVGKQVCVVTNLKPVKLRGVDSNGMLLASTGNDTVSILMPLREVPNGSLVK